jgi:8-oxo-dGTP pyrophosphatase MutT (NUDIX family)
MPTTGDMPTTPRPAVRRRAFCYLTRAGVGGPELLVFRHDDPSAGVQTPGGTIEPGEAPLDGAVREAMEETGLTALGPPRLLARSLFDGAGETVAGYHVHIPVDGPTADRWAHRVSAGEADEGLIFHLSWLDFSAARRTVLPWMISHLSCLE